MSYLIGYHDKETATRKSPPAISARKLAGRACGVLLLWAATAIVLPAQTFTLLHSFDGTDGVLPYGAPMQGLDGNLYATTTAGSAGYGSVFKITPAGALTTIHSFHGNDGSAVNGELMLATDGSFFGTTYAGGEGNTGTIFAIASTGRFATFYNFDFGSAGIQPDTGVLQLANGNFYGATSGGAEFSCGAIFEITPGGVITTLHAFDSTDGCTPSAWPIQTPNGNLYGTTAVDGGDGYGTVYELTAGGTFSTLYSFNGTTGSEPGQMTLASDGNMYGITFFSSANSGGPGTIFRVTPGGTVTTLYSFCALSGCADGEVPYGALIQATNGQLYGTTTAGGANGDGTVFELTLAGTLTTLHSFGGLDGADPIGGLSQATSGILYGTTSVGGAHGDGTVYSLNLGLAPFVRTLPSAGAVGSSVKILGTNLSSVTSVTFNGVPATFTEVSPTYLTTTVPAGATSGLVKVSTSSGVLNSSVVFRVVP
jgi:uncharacterized repeat protein (TIGR03803 family)